MLILANPPTSFSASSTMVVCNVDWESMEAAGLSEGQQLIRDAFDEYGVSDYVVLEKGDTDIAVVGVFGKDALACAPTCELLFKDPIEAVKETVEEIMELVTDSHDVAVMIEGCHSCMTARGIRKSNAVTTTTTLRGRFKTDPMLQMNLFQQLHAGR